MRNPFKTINQSGDTIVEVLFAGAVVGLIVVGSFVAANASIAQELRAQERSVALQYAQNQVEELRACAENQTECTDVTHSDQAFPYGTISASSLDPTYCMLTPYTYSNVIDSSCSQNIGSVTPLTNSTVSITGVDLSAITGEANYTVSVNWNGTVDNLQLTYDLND